MRLRRPFCCHHWPRRRCKNKSIPSTSASQLASMMFSLTPIVPHTSCWSALSIPKASGCISKPLHCAWKASSASGWTRCTSPAFDRRIGSRSSGPVRFRRSDSSFAPRFLAGGSLLSGFRQPLRPALWTRWLPRIPPVTPVRSKHSQHLLLRLIDGGSLERVLVSWDAQRASLRAGPPVGFPAHEGFGSL